MTQTEQNVIAYPDEKSALAGYAALQDAGYGPGDIEILAKKPQELTHLKGMAQESMRVSPSPWGDIATGALVGGAIGSLAMYAMEILVYHGGKVFGMSALYPLLGVAFGLLVGLFLGALIGWYRHLSKPIPENDYAKALSKRNILFLLKPKAGIDGGLQDLSHRTNGLVLT